MLADFLHSAAIAPLLILLAISGVLLAAAEWGYRQGWRISDDEDEASRSEIGTLQGAVLGLLGLLLGFTFAMSVERFETRRDLVVQEANAIGTTYLRAAFLAEPHRLDVEDLLRRYVGHRLEFYRAGVDQARIDAAEAAAAAIQQRLWDHAVAVAKEAPTPITASFVASLNETIDLDAVRFAEMRNRVPLPVWLLVLLVAGCGCWGSGYGAGTVGARSAYAQIILPLLIAVVITTLVDFSTPRSGFIGVDQGSLIQLQQNLSKAAR